MKLYYLPIMMMAFCACSGNASKTNDHQSDEAIADNKKVDSLLSKDDSLMKAKEKELMEKYR